jgi:hypothetical protein
MGHLLGKLHVLSKQLGNLWVLGALLGQASLERSAEIGCSNSRCRDDNGVRCSDWFLWCWLQRSALLLQERRQVICSPGFIPAGTVSYSPRYASQTCDLDRVMYLTRNELVFQLNTAQFFPI